MGFGERFDGAVASFFGSYRDGFVAGLFECGDHFRSPALRQVTGEESTVADDDAECHFGKFHFCHLSIPPGSEFRYINYADQEQKDAPPDGGVKFGKLYRLYRGRIEVLVKAGTENQDSIGQ
jgi:catechol 2,3-dioxygenase-like lactoylglutathione lyase family enzyme